MKEIKTVVPGATFGSGDSGEMRREAWQRREA